MTDKQALAAGLALWWFISPMGGLAFLLGFFLFGPAVRYLLYRRWEKKRRQAHFEHMALKQRVRDNIWAGSGDLLKMSREE